MYSSITMLITSVTQKGQVTIPSLYRDMFGIKTGSKVIFEEKEGLLELRPAPDFFSFQGALAGNKGATKKGLNKAIGEYLAGRNLISRNGKSN